MKKKEENFKKQVCKKLKHTPNYSFLYAKHHHIKFTRQHQQHTMRPTATALRVFLGVEVCLNNKRKWPGTAKC